MQGSTETIGIRSVCRRMPHAVYIAVVIDLRAASVQYNTAVMVYLRVALKGPGLSGSIYHHKKYTRTCVAALLFLLGKRGVVFRHSCLAFPCLND